MKTLLLTGCVILSTSFAFGQGYPDQALNNVPAIAPIPQLNIPAPNPNDLVNPPLNTVDRIQQGIQSDLQPNRQFQDSRVNQDVLKELERRDLLDEYKQRSNTGF